MFTNIQQYSITLPPDLITKIYELKYSTKPVGLRSNVNGWQSKQYTKVSELPWVEDFLNSCLKELNLSNYEIRHFWFNINPKGAYHNWHSHGGTVQVAVCYLQVPKNSGNIEFKIKEEIHTLEPVNGMLIAFPSGIDHRVTINETNEDRITMAFNLHTKS